MLSPRFRVLELGVGVANLAIELPEASDTGVGIAQQLRTRHRERALGGLGVTGVRRVPFDGDLVGTSGIRGWR